MHVESNPWKNVWVDFNVVSTCFNYLTDVLSSIYPKSSTVYMLASKMMAWSFPSFQACRVAKETHISFFKTFLKSGFDAVIFVIESI